MKNRHLSPALALITLCVMQVRTAEAQFGLFGSGTRVDVIETTELKTLLSNQQQAEAKARQAGAKAPAPDFVVVDVRSDAEVNVSVIPGAITKAQYEQNRGEYQGRTVIPYCTVGGRSSAYAKELAAKGVTVRNYQGSILEWVGAELPLVTLDGQPTNRIHTYSSRYRVPSKYQKVTR